MKYLILLFVVMNITCAFSADFSITTPHSNYIALDSQKVRLFYYFKIHNTTKEPLYLSTYHRLNLKS